MCVNVCVTVVIVHLVSKQSLMNWLVLVVGLQYLLLYHVVHRLPHVSFHAQFLSHVVIQSHTVAILETVLLVQCLLQKNVLAGM